MPVNMSGLLGSFEAIPVHPFADIEHTTRPSDDFVANAQIAIAESDLTADTSDISLRLEPVAAAGGAIEVNRQTGRKKRNRGLRVPLPCLAKGDIGEGDNEAAVSDTAPVAMVFRYADPKYDTGACTPLQERTDALEKATRLRVSFETGWRLLRLSHLSLLRTKLPVSLDRACK
jgi:hypothetical protein